MDEKILIVAPSWIGDCVMAQPLFSALKKRYPDAPLHVFAPAWSMAVLNRMPEVAEIIENPFGHGQVQLLKRYRTGKALRGRGYSRAIILPGSLKSALVPFFAKIPVRTGFIGESRYGLLNDIRHLDETALPRMVDRFTALAYPAGKMPADAPSVPHLDVSAGLQAACLKKFALDTARPIMAFCPGAEYGPAKRWPARHFAALARHYAAEGAQIWYFGSAKDREIAAEIMQAAPQHSVNLCGKTRLDEAIDLLALAQTVVCNDSGLMHVAAALGRELVALYGSSSPDHTPPLSKKAQIVSLNLECSPCFERVCPLGHTDCLEKLPPERVIEAVKHLQKQSQSPAPALEN